MDVFKTLILDTPDSLDNISGVLPVVNGGTGADNASDARVNLLPDYTGNANKVLSLNGTATDVEWTSNGAGDVAGPASSTDNAVARFDSTTGKVIQNSGVTISDANLLTADALSINNNTTLGSSNTDTVDFNARIASEFTPATDNTYDLGRTGHEWRDLYLDGTANIDSLIADTADINGGTIDGTTIGATTPAAGTFSQVNSTGAIIATGAGSFGDDTDITGDLTVTGNVGIGTSAPSTFRTKVLEVADTNNAGIVVNGDATNAYASLRLTNSGTSGWDLNYNFPNAGDLGFFDIGAADTRMTITSTGNIGVGTSAPGTKLSVQTATNGGIAVNDGTVNGIIYGSTTLTNSFAIGTTTNHPVIFGTNNTFPQMTLATNGRVGIGTSSPDAVLNLHHSTDSRLRLTGGTVGASYGMEWGFNSSSAIYAETKLDYDDRATKGLQINATYPISFNYIDNSGVFQGNTMTLTTAGNVGVGTAAPDSKLHVRNDGTDAILAKFESDIGVNTRDFRIKSPVLDSTTYPFRFTTSNSFAFEVDGVENLRIHSNGNVGVGTTAPTAKLVVAGGGAAIQGNGFPTTGAGWEFYTDTTSGSWAQSYSRTSSAWLDANWNALTHKYSTSGAERMRINSAGDVFIGGTTLNGSENTAGYSVGGASWRVSRNVTTNVNQIVFFNPNGAVGAIQTNGSATSYNTSSDYRLKENVVPMQDALQRITQLKPSRFNFIADDSLVVDGFLAHEVQEVVPEAISGEKDAMRDEEYEVTPAVLDDDGNETTPAVMDTRSVPDYQGIDQSKLVPLLVGAVQELTARLEALENN